MLGKYYNLSKLLKQNATFNILYGGRNSGKSYAVKNYCVEEAFLNNKLFMLLFRRQSGKNTNSQIETYFNDCKIKKITKGEWEGVKVRAKKLYLIREEMDKNYKIKIKYGPCIGGVGFLDSAEELKSLCFEYVHFIFEEFITKTGYVEEEPVILDSLISTVVRQKAREEIKVFLIGNTVSRVNPYRTEWNLTRWAKQKIDTIDIYTLESGLKIALEYIPNKTGISSIAITKKGKQLEDSEWEASEFPLIEKGELEKYREVYKFYYYKLGMGFCFRCFVNENDIFLYCEPFTKIQSLNNKSRIISDVYFNTVYYTKEFTPLVENEKQIFSLLKAGKVMFNQHLTGEDFYNCLNS